MHYGRDWRFPETPPPPIEPCRRPSDAPGLELPLQPARAALSRTSRSTWRPANGWRWSADRAAASDHRHASSPASTSRGSGEVRIDGHTLRRMGSPAARPCRGDGRPGHPPVQGLTARQRHPVGETIPHRACGRAINDAGLADVLEALAGNQDQRHRGGRAPPERRSAPAAGDRPRARPGAGGAGARRGDQRARSGERSAILDAVRDAA